MPNKIKKKVSIIGTNGLPAKYGGFETLVEYLTLNLNEQFDIIVYCSKTPTSERKEFHNNSRLVYLPFKANNFQSIIYDIVSIFHSWFKYDILLILGVSGCIVLPFRFLFRKKKIILNFGGLDWKRSKWNYFTRKFLKFSEKIAIKFSDIIISDNEMIAEYVKKEYHKSSTIIEYGGDQVNRIELNENNISKYDFLATEYYLSVARLQSDNNLEMMLDAFSQLPDKKFALVSNWDFSNYGIELKKKYKNYKNLFLIGPIYDQYELNLIRSNCFAYIHGHSAGGTNPALVEAMYLSLPIIAFGVPFNQATTEYKALYFRNAEELIELIKSQNQEYYNQLSLIMKEIADRRYIWEKISKKYSQLI